MKKMQLSTKIFIGFFLGIVLGLVFKEQVLVIKPLGDLFLKLIKMIVVPLILFSIIGGVTNIGDVKKLKTVGSLTIVYYIVTTMISAVIAMTVANIIKPGAGFVMQMTEQKVEATAMPKIMDTILNMVPANPIEALVKADLMQIIVFSIFFGIALTILGAKSDPLKNVINIAADAMYKVTSIVMEFSPIGVTALMAVSVGQYGLKIFGPLGKLIGAHYIGLIVILGLYVIMLKFIAKFDIGRFFKYIPRIWVVTASTTSSSGTLPVTIKTTEEEFGVKSELANFTLPLGATMNMNGSCNYFAMATVFVSQIYNLDLSIYQLFMIVILTTIISVGAPGIPGGGIVLTAMLLNTMGMPVEIMGLIAGVYRLIDMGNTTLNVTGDVVCTLCIANQTDMYSSSSGAAVSA